MVDTTGFEELEPTEVDVAPTVAAQLSAICSRWIRRQLARR